MSSQIINIVIGGGAAGIFAAIRCKTQNPHSQVILLEKTNQLLAKVRISGGGRCNVTHACFDPKKLVQNYPRGSKELIGPFHTFQPKDTVAWFEQQGVLLKTENDGRMFPTTDSSETIIQCLMHAAAQLGVDIRKQQRIVSIQKQGHQFLIQLQDQQISADAVLLATGSSSWGYSVAKDFGHEIVEPVPSLFTFNIPTSPLLDLQGIAVPNVIVTLKDTPLKQQGPLLITHWGFSGPAVLKLSAWAARTLHDLQYKAILLVNWLASQNQEALYQSLLQRKSENPLQSFPPLLPSNLLQRLLASLNMDPVTPLGKLPNKALAQLAAKLHADPYAIEGKTTYKQEFVTAGGVDLKGIDFKTMESRKTPGLFFAGEILNIDGVTGGFNFQNAWTTGWLAGTAMGEEGVDKNISKFS
ncbi:MAG: NAD(P)/FAD-dependent oxidoreductase [Verrucomicrobia bacterium]|nr:NAD(P)/FAD-dependent oxidoreductase [Verrucomicrobiota bacterium]